MNPDKTLINPSDNISENAQSSANSTTNSNSVQKTELPETPAILAKEYRYMRLLGEGANGKTYLAINVNTGEQLAVKSLKLSQSENLKSYELFQREAEVLSSVQIDGVPLFHKSIVSDELGGECYIIQQFIDSPSILDALETGRIYTEVETLKLMRQVAVILNALHKEYVPPIIHRDIKPSNILCEIPKDGTMGKAYLIDFGAVANPQHKTGGSTVAGTYGYMPPEQMVGECTTASDMYSLGATALHMLTGVPPYKIEADVFKLKYEETIREHAPETSEYMIKLIGELLVTEALKRIDDAEVLLQKIDRVLEGRDPDEGANTADDSAVNSEELQKLKDKYTRSSSWITTKGVLHARTFRIHECFEYTFMAKAKFGFFSRKDVFCCGLYPVKNLDHIYADIKQKDLPLPCTISYNPSNPRYNVLVSIDLTSKNKPDSNKKLLN